MFGRCFVDGTVQDGIYDSSRVFYGDTFAGAIPTCIDQICFCSGFSIFLTNSSAYFVGCSERNAAPKHAEKVGVGSVIPLSVPANLAVNPDKK